jgi:hypothetical protein
MAGPFKMTGFSGFGNSPLKHPHRTWEEVGSHDKDQPHPKESIVSPTDTVDNMGKKVVKVKKKKKSKIQPRKRSKKQLTHESKGLAPNQPYKEYKLPI